MKRGLLWLSLWAGCSSLDVPRAPIELVVDGMGITHVMAKSDHDAFYGAGYAMARDRLFQMEMSRRQARGTQSQILGDSYLQSDIAARVIGFARLGAADADRVRRERPDDAALVEAWAAGINRRIDEIASGKVPRPYAFEQLNFVPQTWTIEDAHAVGKTLAFGLSNTLDQDLLASVARTVVPDTAAHFPFVMPAYDEYIVPQATPQSAHRTLSPPSGPRVSPEQLRALASYRPIFPGNGSNNWAVDGSHTDSGRPYVCGDPHQPISGPPPLWPVHMSSVAGGGHFNVVGFVFPGTPTVELGHNETLAWTATTNFADVMDLWEVDPDNDRRSVTLGDGPHAISARDETILVKTGDNQFDEHHVTVEQVEGHGVLLPPEMLPIPTYLFTSHEVLFNWTGFRVTADSSAYLELDRARDLDEFEHAIDQVEVGAVNFVAADMTGIDYRSHSSVPDRGDPSSHEMPWHILPGSDADSFWSRGDLPLEKLPHLRSPSSGYLFTANNDPFGFTADGDVSDDPWYYGAFFASGARAARIHGQLQSLIADHPITRADMEGLQDDVHTILAEDLLPALHTAVAGADPAQAGYADRVDLERRLAAWDRRMSVDSSEALIFTGLEWFASKRAFGPAVTDILFDAIAAKSPPYLIGTLRSLLANRISDPTRYAPDGIDALLVGALGDTAAWLRARFGSLDAGAFHLGDVAGVQFLSVIGGAADGAWTPVSGGLDTVFVDESAFFDQGMPRQQMSANEMSLYRMVIGFGDDGTPQATLDFERGTNENPSDPHFDDQEPDWLAGAHKPLAFSPADIEAQATDHTTLR